MTVRRDRLVVLAGVAAALAIGFWPDKLVSGHGRVFQPVTARFVRITQTATVPDAPPWTMRLLRFYAAPVARPPG